MDDILFKPIKCNKSIRNVKKYAKPNIVKILGQIGYNNKLSLK